MTIYDDLQGIAAGLLKDFNQGGISLVQLTPGVQSARVSSFSLAFDLDAFTAQIPDDPDYPPAPIETLVPLEGVARGASYKYVRQGLAVKGDLEVTVAVKAGINVGIDDHIMVKSDKYKIVEDLTVPAAGTPVTWKFIARRGG